MIFSNSGYDLGTHVMGLEIDQNFKKKVVFEGRVLDFITEITELLGFEVAQTTLFKCSKLIFTIIFYS